MAARVLPLHNSSVAVLASVFLGIVLVAQDLSERTVVPVELRSALRAGPEQFARAGAAHGLSMGIIRTSTWVSVEMPGIATKSTEGRATVADLFELFRTLHPDYEASISDGLLKFRPVTTSICDAGLSAQVPAMSVSDTDVAVVSRLIDLSLPVKAGKPVMGGTVGSSLSQPGEPIRTIPERRIFLKLGSAASLESALDRLARTLRGTTWMASEGTDSTTGLPNCFVSMFRSDGTAAVFGVDLARRD